MTLRPRLGLTILLTAIPLVAGLAWLRQDIERRALEDRLREVAETYMDRRGREDYAYAPELFGGRLGGGREGRRGSRRGPRGPGRRGPDGPPPPRGERPAGPPDEAGPGGRRRGPPDGPRGGPGRRGPPEEGSPRPPPRRGVPPSHQTWLWAYDAGFTSANPAAPAFPDALRDALASGVEGAGAAFALEGREGYQYAAPMLLDEVGSVYVLVQRLDGDTQSAVPDLIWGGVILCGVLFLVVLFAAGPLVRRIRRLTTEVRRSAAARYAQPVAVRGSDEIAGLARAFNEAGAEVRGHLQDLEAREKTLRGFLANTTHDVMIPLTVLQGHLSAMRKRLEQGAAVDTEQVVSSLEEAHYMASLVHNLSAVAKLEAGERHVQRHPVDLNAVVERAVARHRPMGRAREIQVDFAVPETVVRVDGDVTLLEQAVSNLVHNAVRYNVRGGHVAVILEAHQNSPAGFSLRVLDDGPGIPADQLERLTERRFRGDGARSRHPEGLGLGLDIARDVAERHGLSLTFRASEYGGLEAELRGTGLQV